MQSLVECVMTIYPTAAMHLLKLQPGFNFRDRGLSPVIQVRTPHHQPHRKRSRILGDGAARDCLPPIFTFPLFGLILCAWTAMRCLCVRECSSVWTARVGRVRRSPAVSEHSPPSPPPWTHHTPPGTTHSHTGACLHLPAPCGPNL